MKKFVFAAAAAFMFTSVAATAGGGYTSGVVSAGQDDWSKEALNEPCMNGDVSSTGVFSSQLAEEKAAVRMGLAGSGES